MARPAGTKNNKRKVTALGGSKAKQSQPGPQRKRQARAEGKPSNDVYEAEDSDPDEVKHSYRYDRVDNYEYEAPSEIEDDEEIDEELAFTSEDKKKYGGWFGDDEEEAGGSPDEDEGAREDDEEQRDKDLDILYSDEELQEGKPDDDEEELGTDDLSEQEGEDGVGKDDEVAELMRRLGEDEGEEGQEDDEEEDGKGGSDDEERYRDMLAAVAGVAAAPKHASGRMSQRVVNEAYPEAEFALNPGAASAGGGGELTLADLMAGLGGEGRKKLPAALRKELDRMSKGTKTQVVSAPLPRVIKERAERTAGYALTKQEVDKWQPLVKANREAPALQFTSARDDVPRISTTAAMVAQHTAETAMEYEVAALLEAAGAASATAVAASEEALSAKALTVEEARERRGRLARLRSLLFYHELKAKRLKNIKSKEFHRKAAKASKRKDERALLAGAEGEEDGGARAAEHAEEETAEFERAKERLTLKHRNTSRWARRALKRGATIIDEGTKAAVAEQLRLGEALRRRIEGEGRGAARRTTRRGVRTRAGEAKKGKRGAGECGVGASDGEGGGAADVGAGGGSGRGMSNRVKALAMDILSGPGPLDGGDDLPKKGLFALPFMARALERKRQSALQDATAALNDLKDQEDGNGDGIQGSGSAAAAAPQGKAGRRKFGAGFGAAPAAPGVDSDNALESDEDEDVEAKAERLRKQLEGGTAGGGAAAGGRAGGKAGERGGAAGAGRARQPTAEEEADLDRALADTWPGAAHAQAGAGMAEAAAPSTGKGGKAARRAAAAANATPVAAPQSDPAAAFVPAKKFQGAKPGMVFTKGPKGLGYYPDKASSASPTPSAQQARQGGSTKGRAQATTTTNLAATAGKLALASQQAKPAAHTPKAAAAPPPTRTNGHPARPADDDSGSEGEGDGQREGMVSGAQQAGGKAAQQRALVSMAFAGDDVEAEFEAAKAAEVAAELPKVEEPSALPGWGAWADQQRNPKWMRDAKAKAQREREKAAAGRADASLQHVVLSEKYDRKAMTRYTTPQVPFPFDSRETYERSIRQPLGREYNPDSSFKDLIRPAVLKNTGVVIEPIRFSKPLARQAAERTQKANKAKVLTVAGGVVKTPRKPS